MDTKELPSINICAYCQKEFPSVDTAVKAHHHDMRFNHGMCIRHAIAMLKSMNKDDNFIKSYIESKKTKMVPDLKENPDLVKSYSKELFTPDQIQQAQQVQQTENNTITERFKKLAGINK